MSNITEDNFLVWNQGRAPVVGYNFMLRVELLFDLPCKSVRAFTREMEYELIQEGGLNDYVHMRRKPISKPFYFEIERYIGVDYIDPLPVGAELVLPVLLFVSRNQGQFIPFVTARTFVFTGCRVIKKTYGDLNAEQSGLATESTTIAYNEMLCVDIPWSSADALNFASGAVQHEGQDQVTNALTVDQQPRRESLDEPVTSEDGDSGEEGDEEKNSTPDGENGDNSGGEEDNTPDGEKDDSSAGEEDSGSGDGGTGSEEETASGQEPESDANKPGNLEVKQHSAAEPSGGAPKGNLEVEQQPEQEADEDAEPPKDNLEVEQQPEQEADEDAEPPKDNLEVEQQGRT